MKDSDPSKPRRRWYQLRPWTSRVLYLLCVVACSWLAIEWDRARTAKKMEADLAWSNLVHGRRIRTHITDANLESMATEHSNMEILHLTCSQVTDAGLEHLRGLTSLKLLSLWHTQVTDGGLEHLRGLTSLQDLYLCDTQVTDAGLECLKGLTSLSRLYLYNTQVTDEGVEKLQQAMPNCEIRH